MRPITPRGQSANAFRRDTYTDNSDGNAHQQRETAAATAAALEPIFLTRPAAAWVDQLAPSGAANHAAQLLEDPQVQARGTVVESAGVPVPASPLRLRAPDGGRTVTATAAPHTVGADTEDVLTAAGFSADELAGLAQQGVL